MKIEIVLQPLFSLQLTRDDVEPLIQLASHHYDAVCRAAARPGGFLYGWRNITSVTVAVDHTPSCTATRRELDTVLKICEGMRMAVNCKLLSVEQGESTDRLCKLIMSALETGTRATYDFKPIDLTEPSKRGEMLWATSPGRW